MIINLQHDAPHIAFMYTFYRECTLTLKKIRKKYIPELGKHLFRALDRILSLPLMYNKDQARAG